MINKIITCRSLSGTNCQSLPLSRISYICIFLGVKAPALTGYFRDRKRRIDMVFVADNTDEVRIERLKVNFLRNVAASGLEMEFEMPVVSCSLLTNNVCLIIFFF